MLTLVCISDTHGYHDQTIVPEGDILLHAGDLTRLGTLEDVEDFNRWLGTLPHRHKVVIAGNHDFCFEQELERARQRLTHAIYLQDESIQIEGLLIYGSPWQPWFFDWAFNLQRGPELAARWAQIPDATDILLTHGPPAGIGDLTIHGESVGCADLRERIQQIQPRLHVFGHIHEAAGVFPVGPTLHINASTQMGAGKGVVVQIFGDRLSGKATHLVEQG